GTTNHGCSLPAGTGERGGSVERAWRGAALLDRAGPVESAGRKRACAARRRRIALCVPANSAEGCGAAVGAAAFGGDVFRWVYRKSCDGAAGRRGGADFAGRIGTVGTAD